MAKATLTIQFSTTVDSDNTIRLTVEVTNSTNISKNIFLMNIDGKTYGICTTYDLINTPENPETGKYLYRTNIATYTPQDVAEVIKIKNQIKEYAQKLADAWSQINDVVGVETWTSS